MAYFGPTRRSLLQGALATTALGLTGFPARADVQWKKYAGTTLEANLIKGPRGELLQKYASEFTDLTGFMKDTNLTAPDLTVDDFSAGGLKFAQNDKREMHSLPWSVDYFILYWNKELFAKKGVALPKTFDEMVAAAEKLNDPANGIYGFTGRGLRNANMTLW